ncbi:MAG: metallophosphoesterase, partial [Bacteroidales bacterium]|nr:metallophosphoesterase [Bacteroidales bacterium]
LWDIAEKSILAQLEVLKDYKGEVIFIPGNHDWANGRKEGLEYVKNQRKYIEDYLNREEVFLPKKGRPGPVEINLSEDIVLILIDSQWWLQENEKSYSGVEDEADLFIQIKDAVSRNRDKKIIFAAHHPLYSVGNHGGHFPLTNNIFPLLEIKKILYIPLPGFIYTGYRKIFGINQDLSHPNYKLLKEALLETFKGHSDIIYVAGHDHNLQYVNKNSIHHIISGAAGLTTYVARSKKTDFAQMQDGFATLDFYDNGDIWLEFWVTHDDQSQSAGRKDPVGNLAFRKKLFNKPIYVEKEQKKLLSQIDFSDSTVVVYPNGEKYQAGKIKKIFLGSNYRKEWITPIEVPVFDFNKEKGGLKILKKGGGCQTKSLRLEDKNGKQWVLRSMEKDPSVAIPEVVKVNLAVDLLEDQMSACLPYATLSVPRLADAIEIYHTNPKVFYLTKDPRLGKYLDDISEGLFLFEERPAGNRKDVVSFGQSKKIIGSPDLLENIFEDPKYKVDQSFFLKSRFLDIFINDWDRHEDQWRWASFEKKGNIIYKPIPRDRDQTFFLNEGIIPWIASRKFAVRMNQGIDYDIKDMGGLTMQGIHLDRRFLNELSLEDWLSTAKKMQNQLTDKVIEDAIYDMPEEITEINGKELISKLKSRRDKLNEFAKTYYSIMASKVDIVGTNKREYFLVERLNDQTTKVTVFTLNKKGKKKEDIYYQRLFNSDETKEIRLFGLAGKDEFKVTGEVNKGIKVRIVGGKGNDKITDKSEVKGLSKKTFVYDTKVKNDIKLGHEARNLTSNNPDNNQYIYKAFNYNKLIPLAYFGFNA